MKRLLAKAFNQARRLKSSVAWLEAALGDRLLNICTSNYDEKNFTGQNHNGYHSKGYLLTWMFLRQLRLSRSDTFFDIGCGSGRMLCLAALMGAGKCVGVEISETLSRQARINADRRRFSRTHIEIRHADAIATQYGGGTVFALYNPFGGSVLEKVLAEIRENVDANPRPVRFIYINAFNRDVFDRCGWLKLTREVPRFRICYYENIPHPEPARGCGRRMTVTPSRVLAARG